MGRKSIRKVVYFAFADKNKKFASCVFESIVGKKRFTGSEHERGGWSLGAVLRFFAQACEVRGCRSVELRALCNEVPRTPPGPEGSNGTGNASGAADVPKFLALAKAKGNQFSDSLYRNRKLCKGNFSRSSWIIILTENELSSHRKKISTANVC
jgi:hypothetical protein